MRKLALEAKMLKYCPICNKRLNQSIKNGYTYYKSYTCNECSANIKISKIHSIYYSINNTIYYKNNNSIIYCWNSNNKTSNISFYYYFNKDLWFRVNNTIPITINNLSIKDAFKYVKKYTENNIFL